MFDHAAASLVPLAIPALAVLLILALIVAPVLVAALPELARHLVPQRGAITPSSFGTSPAEVGRLAQGDAHAVTAVDGGDADASYQGDETKHRQHTGLRCTTLAPRAGASFFNERAAKTR
jgi:hypothetical protein